VSLTSSTNISPVPRRGTRHSKDKHATMGNAFAHETRAVIIFRRAVAAHTCQHRRRHDRVLSLGFAIDSATLARHDATFPPCFSGLPGASFTASSAESASRRASNEENAGAAARAQEKQKHDPSLGPVFVGFVKPVVDASRS